VDLLAHHDQISMESFGYETRDGSPLYPCRAVYQGEVVPGRYDHATKTCYVAHKHEVRGVKSQVEILIFPQGLEDKCSIYKLMNKKQVSWKSAVPVGTSFKQKNVKSFVAYGSLTGVNGASEMGIGQVEVVNEILDNGKCNFWVWLCCSRATKFQGSDLQFGSKLHDKAVICKFARINQLINFFA